MPTRGTLFNEKRSIRSLPPHRDESLSLEIQTPLAIRSKTYTTAKAMTIFVVVVEIMINEVLFRLDISHE